MELLKGPLTAVLCIGLIVPSGAPAESRASASVPAKHAKARPAYVSDQLQNDQRILHALNRFTFGPRPGDLEVVRSIGLDAWFEQQLHPETLDLTDLNARLAQYPAMQWSTEDLLYRLPSNALLRQVANGRLEMPQQPVLRVIYQNQMARIAEKKQEQDQKKAAAGAVPMTASAAPPAPTASDAEKTENPAPMAKDPAAGSEMSMVAPPASSTPSITTAEIDSILDLPPVQRVERLLAMPQPDLDAFLKTLRPLERVQLAAGLTPDQKQIVAALEGPEKLVAEELIAQRLTRDIYSTAQLQEVMTDFWFNHFNVYLRKNETMPYELVSYERDVIRPLALGKFEDLLEATAHSPAMLLYLDNAESIGPRSLAAERAEFAASRRPGAQKKVREGLNENYARELMELHTLGVNGGYTQADVTEVARILTGWTVERPLRGGGFQFEPNRHEPGTKKALGQKFKEQGEQEGRELLHALATSPATAQFLSRKLAIRFVSDDPPQALVDRMAQSYLASGGDIAQVLRTLFRSPEFWSTSVYRAKVKTPLEYVVSAVRASDANIENLRPIANALRAMGMPLYGCVPPSGYDWKASSWVSTGALVDRMNFALNLAANRLPGVTTAWADTVETDAAAPTIANTGDPQVEEARLEALLVGGGVSDATRQAVLTQFQQQMAQNAGSASPLVAQPVAAPARAVLRPGALSAAERQDQVLAGLLLGSPEFQRR